MNPVKKLIFMVLLAVIVAGIYWFGTQYSKQAADDGQSGLANPASQNCIQKGGTLEIRQNKKGQYGVCLFEDNRQCEEWAMLNGDCPVGGVKVTGYVTPAAQYCAITGGAYSGDYSTPGETGTCAFKNGKICAARDYYNGQCSPE